jgi:hypothetical protein
MRSHCAFDSSYRFAIRLHRGSRNCHGESEFAVLYN